MKKFFVLFVALVCMFCLDAPQVMAMEQCGEECQQAQAAADANGSGVFFVWSPWSNFANGGAALGGVDANAYASATGKEHSELQIVGWLLIFPIWDWVSVPAEGEAEADVDLDIKSRTFVFTNGPQWGGLSFSAVLTKATMDIDMEAWAEGDIGCPQFASVSIDGVLGAKAYGTSLAFGPYGAFAKAGGYGITFVSFEGYEQDQSNGFAIGKDAYVDFNSTVTAKQGMFAMSYVSPAGNVAWNFAKVTGGSGSLDLGNDGLFGKDNITLTGIQSQGAVYQQGLATNGMGAYAGGSSSAAFGGATGYITNGGRCGPDQTANAGGMAIVSGFNSVSPGFGSLSITSHQHAYATTGGQQQQVVISEPQLY